MFTAVTENLLLEVYIVLKKSKETGLRAAIQAFLTLPLSKLLSDVFMCESIIKVLIWQFVLWNIFAPTFDLITLQQVLTRRWISAYMDEDRWCSGIFSVTAISITRGKNSVYSIHEMWWL